jgi:hypothetical protein
MANPFAGYMTVRAVMKEIGARSASTVTRMAYDEEKPRPAGKRLAGTLIPGHGWMIQRKSVAAFLQEEAAKPQGVGFPRGRGRSHGTDVPPEAAQKSGNRSAKSAKPARKKARG